MTQFGGKDSKRHFTVVIGNKEHGLYVSSTPSSAAKKAVTKLCAANKSKKVEFSIREITQGSKKKTYGPYEGYIEKLKEPIELMGRVIRYKPVAKLSGKLSAKKGGMIGGSPKSIALEHKKGNNRASSNDNNNIGNPAEGSAQVNNNDFFLPEIIARIQFSNPDPATVNPSCISCFYEKLKELKEMDKDILDISIEKHNRNNYHNVPEKIEYFIYFKNFSEFKKNENFKEKLDKLIRLLIYFKKAKSDYLFDTEFKIYDPDDEIFKPEYNEFLKFLATKI
jgi:hypothetical protein